MRRLSRILSGLAILVLFAFGVARPASATHWLRLRPDLPSLTALSLGRTKGHEHIPPKLGKASATDPCVVIGTIVPGRPARGYAGPLGLHLIPGNDARHSHYLFLNTAITCASIAPTTLRVTSTGGNDGHLLDLPLGTRPHAFNVHHGSTNVSGWSNSSGFSLGSRLAALGSDRLALNGCGNLRTNQNKGDITIGANRGWVKYIRVGVVVYAWGCVPGGPFPVFSAVLLVFPPALLAIPGCLPLGLLPLPLNRGKSCGFSIGGVAGRSVLWLIKLVLNPLRLL